MARLGVGVTRGVHCHGIGSLNIYIHIIGNIIHTHYTYINSFGEKRGVIVVCIHWSESLSGKRWE